MENGNSRGIELCLAPLGRCRSWPSCSCAIIRAADSGRRCAVVSPASGRVLRGSMRMRFYSRCALVLPQHSLRSETSPDNWLSNGHWLANLTRRGDRAAPLGWLDQARLLVADSGCARLGSDGSYVDHLIEHVGNVVYVVR